MGLTEAPYQHSLAALHTFRRKQCTRIALILHGHDVMNTTSFELFEIDFRAAGFDEVTQRNWDPNTVLPEHTHPFDANAVVAQGEMWLTCGGVTRHFETGSTFSIPKGTPHAERYGSEGASYWVARRN